MAEPQQLDGQLEGAGGEPMQMDETIERFISAVNHYQRTFFKKDVSEEGIIDIHNLFEAWNSVLHRMQGGEYTGAIVSHNILNETEVFISSLQNLTSTREAWIRDWLAWWNDFLLAQQGESPVSKWIVILTAIGLLLYAVDISTDLSTAVYFAYSGFWGRCALTLGLVYVAVAISTGHKLAVGAVLWSGPFDRLWYLGSLLVNWPDLQVYWSQFQAEWSLARSATGNAYLVPVWQQSKLRVAMLKYTEGACEACPQALLQLVLLLPDLDGGDITWTIIIRIVTTAISLCTAGATLVNREKINRFFLHAALPPVELAALYLWAVPVTVSRLLCLALLLSVHLYEGLAFMTLHVVLFGTYLYSIERVPRTFKLSFGVLQFSVLFLISPFDSSIPCPPFAVRHVIHFLGNTGVMVLWALTTPLYCTRPTLYTALLFSIAALFVIGVLGWQLHRKNWPLYHIQFSI